MCTLESSEAAHIALERLCEERGGDGLAWRVQWILREALDVDLRINVPQRLAHVGRRQIGRQHEAQTRRRLKIVQPIRARAARVEAALLRRHFLHELLQREEEAKHELVLLFDVAHRHRTRPLPVEEWDALPIEYLGTDSTGESALASARGGAGVRRQAGRECVGANVRASMFLFLLLAKMLGFKKLNKGRL